MRRTFSCRFERSSDVRHLLEIANHPCQLHYSSTLSLSPPCRHDSRKYKSKTSTDEKKQYLEIKGQDQTVHTNQIGDHHNETQYHSRKCSRAERKIAFRILHANQMARECRGDKLSFVQSEHENRIRTFFFFSPAISKCEAPRSHMFGYIYSQCLLQLHISLSARALAVTVNRFLFCNFIFLFRSHQITCARFYSKIQTELCVYVLGD